MDRRDTVLALLVLGATPLTAHAQQAKPPRRIGFFVLTTAAPSAEWLAAFRVGMADLRWVEGRDFVIDERYGDGKSGAAPALAAALMATQPDLVLTGAEQAAAMLMQKGKTIPVVFAISKDLVTSGVAVSLARPGGNATGLTDLAHGLGAKRLQLLKEAFPRVAHVALLFDPIDVGNLAQVKEIEEAALRLRIRVSTIELGQAAEIDRVFKRGAGLSAGSRLVRQRLVPVDRRRDHACQGPRNLHQQL